MQKNIPKTTTNTPTKKAIAWTIAGSDSGGGAGIQADLLSFADFKVHGCSVITASTAQNSQSLEHIHPLPLEHISAQLHCLQDDMPASAIKIGMLGNQQTTELIAEFLAQSNAFVVCDPVMRATCGVDLLEPTANATLLNDLLPCVDLLTPNRPEAEQLLQQTLSNSADIENAARQLLALGCKSVLITGGHNEGLGTGLTQSQSADFFTNGTESYWLLGDKIDSPHSHGSGCSLSSAITACMAQGYEIEDALVLSKAYVTQGIRAAQAVGKGPGAVAHQGWPKQLADLPRVFKTLPTPDVSQSQIHFSTCGTKRLGLYPVVDSLEWIKNLLPLGIETMQLRIKDQPPAALEEQISEAIALASHYNCRLFINDYWQLAIKHGAYGVHLGQEDLDQANLEAIAEAGLCLGLSTHSYWEIARAHAITPSYIAIGPIYETTTKQMRFAEQGVKQLSEWVALLKEDYPLVAIGGINYERAIKVLASGVGSVAMVSAITKAEDYISEVDRLLALLDGKKYLEQKGKY